MPSSDPERYPTIGEFWQRLDIRKVEPDLRRQLESRTRRESESVLRVGAEPTVVAVCESILPGDVPPQALAVFVDQNFDKQLGRGDDRDGQFPRARLVPAGFAAIDEYCLEKYGKRFDAAASEQREEALTAAEDGKIPGPPGFDSAAWFRKVRDLLLLAFGSDPRGMVQMGFPGPSYRTGHIWLSKGEVKARTNRKRGYLEL